MLQNYNKLLLLRVFLDKPTTPLQLRELGREISLAPTSVKNYLKELEKEKLIISQKHRLHNYPIYKANWDGELFKFHKRIQMQVRIQEEGLLKYLESMQPETIILFGSAARGEDTEESDIDIYVQCKEQKIVLEKYEKKLKRKINVFFEANFMKLSKELKNNIINGIRLYGYLRAYD